MEAKISIFFFVVYKKLHKFATEVGVIPPGEEINN